MMRDGKVREGMVEGSTVKLCKQLRYDSVHNTTAVRAMSTIGCKGVQLIEEDHAWPGVSCTLKYISDVLLTLANIHVDELWALDAQKIEGALGRYCLGKESLSCAWRAIQEHS